MDIEIRKVMTLRAVEKQEKNKLLSLWNEYRIELAELTRYPELYKDRQIQQEVNMYLGGKENHSAFFLEHEGEVCGFIMTEFLQANTSEESDDTGRVLRIRDMYLTPLHRGEGYLQFVMENVLAEAEKKRISIVWNWPIADTVMNKLFERFCRWAVNHRSVNFIKTEVTLNGIPQLKYKINLM